MKMKRNLVVKVVGVQYNIILSQITFSNGTSCPVTLQIDNNVYNYGECELFEKLCKYKGNEILVKYSGYKNNNKKIITLSGAWKLLYEKSFSIYVLLCILLLAVFVPGIGVAANGSRRWLSIFGANTSGGRKATIIIPPM